MIYSHQELIIHQEQNIDHPAQADWLLSGFDTPDELQQAALHERFFRTTENAERVIEALGRASLMSDVNRQRHENSTVGGRCLALSEVETEHYHAMAADPKRVAEFIKWFSITACAYFEDATNLKKQPKIGLEIGGKRQGGDWESTGGLDAMARAIPGQVTKIVPEMTVRILERPKDRALEYRFMPFTSFETLQKGAFEYGLIRRRRAVADITASELRPSNINLFKESLGLVVMSQLTNHEKEKIREDVAANPKKNLFLKQHEKGEGVESICPTNNTQAANTAGHAFEVAIRSGVGESTDIIPVSAHYVLTIKQPVLSGVPA